MSPYAKELISRKKISLWTLVAATLATAFSSAYALYDSNQENAVNENAQSEGQVSIDGIPVVIDSSTVVQKDTEYKRSPYWQILASLSGISLICIPPFRCTLLF